MNDSISEAHRQEAEAPKRRSRLSGSRAAEALSDLNVSKHLTRETFGNKTSKGVTSTDSSITNQPDDIASPSFSIERPYSAEASPDASCLRNLDLHGINTTPAEHGFTTESNGNSQSSFAKVSPQMSSERRKRSASALGRSNIERPAETQASAVGSEELPPRLQDLSMPVSNSKGYGTAAVTSTRWYDRRTHMFRPKRPHESDNAPGDRHNGTKQSRAALMNTPSGGMFLQPETHPITEDQLVNEVRGIYAGLVMVEKKCMEIDKQQSQSQNELNHLQWQALIALHRTLLHEHHDFFLASQHPSASPVLRRLAEKYAMPARMWRYGIHSFLELLRHRLPDSLEHMLTFIYMAYSMMTLLLESVPAFEETWIECLGDLARYRMAVEEADMRDREVWSGVARYWYNKAADKSPDVGRIQHHLAVLARPNIVQQLFYYTKSLVSVHSFPSAKESILLLFNPLLDRSKPVNNRHPPVITIFVSAHSILFVKGSVSQFIRSTDKFLSLLDSYIGRIGALFREQGVYVVSSNYAAILEYGQEGAIIAANFDYKILQTSSLRKTYQSAQRFWRSPDRISHSKPLDPQIDSSKGDVQFSKSPGVIAHASHLAFSTLELILQRIGDKNVLPSIHVSLAFLWCFALNPEGMTYIEAEVPWAHIASFLNTLIRHDTDMKKVESEEFPRSDPGTAAQLPEDFLIRGQMWSQLYYPEGFFNNSCVEDEERSIELPSVVVPRTYRCLWLGIRIAMLECWITYDRQAKSFSATPFASQLENAARETNPFDRRSKTLSPEPLDEDTKMIDT